jgi:glycosyltransferase involved in cell wall biosynthesis
LGEPVEVIVVDNDSTDRTAAIALEDGAEVVEEPAKNLAVIRNKGAAAASGDILVFCDADTYMGPEILRVIRDVMASGAYVGGGVGNVRPSRMSLGIALSGLLVLAIGVLYTRRSAVLFYTAPEYFRAIGGFDESLVSIEDVDFAERLYRHGKRLGRRYKNIWKERVVTSSRKFDEYGDWYMVRHPGVVWKAFKRDPDIAKELWYKKRRGD